VAICMSRLLFLHREKVTVYFGQELDELYSRPVKITKKNTEIEKSLDNGFLTFIRYLTNKLLI
jgi:hypothetical protein